MLHLPPADTVWCCCHMLLTGARAGQQHAQQQHGTDLSKWLEASAALGQQQLPALAPGGLNLRSLCHVMDTLVSDVLAKQQVLEQLQRCLDASESRGEVAACRMSDLQGKVR